MSDPDTAIRYLGTVIQNQGIFYKDLRPTMYCQ